MINKLAQVRSSKSLLASILVSFCLFVRLICNRGCQSWPIYYLSSSFLFCKYNLYLQNKSDWSKHKKPANITVTSKICFFGYPRSKFVFLFFSHKNARGKYETREKLSETRSSDRSSVVIAKQQRSRKRTKRKNRIKKQNCTLSLSVLCLHTTFFQRRESSNHRREKKCQVSF